MLGWLLACAMEQSAPRTAAARSWLLLLCLAAVATAGALQARAQPDSIGTLPSQFPDLTACACMDFGWYGE
jgi:hypothetical protein